MKVELPRGIASISGTIGRSGDRKLIAKTFHKPDGTTETRMYLMPQQNRSKPLSEREIQARMRFKRIAQEVAKRMQNGDRRLKKDIWAEVKAQCP